jgi:mono/diheme cytochrome c family protein
MRYVPLHRARSSSFALLALLAISVLGCSPPGAESLAFTSGSGGAPVPRAAGLPGGEVTLSQVLHGRQLVLSHACGDCHGGMQNPESDEWLTGRGYPDELGPFSVWPRNLTPDPETGTGRYTERQLFNSLRFGLRPSATPDVVVTSHRPGDGNHPAQPSYLAPAMPWLAWRYMSDEELWAIAAYLKHGLRPARREIPASQAPPDQWASAFQPELIGPPVLPPFPTAHEELRDESRREQVLRGRRLVASLACGDCHGGATSPAGEGWLIGSNERMPAPLREFQIGEFKTYARNLTPDNATGLGRFSERQIFNSLRYGLRPGETADVEITSGVPGEGNHPANPKYLAIPMPWPAWRHLSDEELWAIAAYLKIGVRPVRHRVPDSEGPPDFWLSAYAPEVFGTYPAPAFPTARERALP